MAQVRFQDVDKSYGEVQVIRDLDLEVHDEEFMVLVGPSGCGKSTALRMIAGLEEVTAGEIFIGDRAVTHLPPKERDIAMVFQSYALYPHMTVRGNMEFGLKLRKTPAEELARRVDEAAAVLGIGDLMDRYPRQLSGGQRQRVAVGRAIVRQPAVFLFDEPLSNLDAKLRTQMRGELAKLQERLKTTTVYVTHDQVEAMTMGHRIAVMDAGVIQQVGTPLEVYEQPANLFVANFIGTPPMNLFAATVTGGGATLQAGSFSVPVPPPLRAAAARHEGREVTVGVRPEDVSEPPPGGAASLAPLSLTVAVVELLGHEVIVHGRAGDDELVAYLDPHRAPKADDRIELAVDAAKIHLFDPQTGRRLEDGET
jgi:multiple sugar transport system ATP-binding protein